MACRFPYSGEACCITPILVYLYLFTFIRARGEDDVALLGVMSTGASELTTATQSTASHQTATSRDVVNTTSEHTSLDDVTVMALSSSSSPSSPFGQQLTEAPSPPPPRHWGVEVSERSAQIFFPTKVAHYGYPSHDVFLLLSLLFFFVRSF